MVTMVFYKLLRMEMFSDCNFFMNWFWNLEQLFHVKEVIDQVVNLQNPVKVITSYNFFYWIIYSPTEAVGIISYVIWLSKSNI